MTLDPTTLRALLNVATRGTWHARTEQRSESWQYIGTGSPDGPGSTVAQWVLPADADLIVALVNAAPALLDVLEAAVAWRDSDEADDGVLPPTRRAADLIDAIDRARGGAR